MDDIDAEHCATTGKRIYRSKQHARRAMRAQRKGRGAHGLSARLRVYRCPECRGFHLTNDQK